MQSTLFVQVAYHQIAGISSVKLLKEMLHRGCQERGAPVIMNIGYILHTRRKSKNSPHRAEALPHD